MRKSFDPIRWFVLPVYILTGCIMLQHTRRSALVGSKLLPAWIDHRGLHTKQFSFPSPFTMTLMYALIGEVNRIVTSLWSFHSCALVSRAHWKQSLPSLALAGTFSGCKESASHLQLSSHVTDPLAVKHNR